MTSRDGRVLADHWTEFATLMGMAPGESKERGLSWLDDSGSPDISADFRKLLVAELEREEARPAPPTCA